MTDASTAVAVAPPSAIAEIKKRFLGSVRLLRDLQPYLDQALNYQTFWTEELERTAERDADRARALRVELPPTSSIRLALDAVSTALHEPASETEATFIIGTMLDGYPAARVGSFKTYVEALMWAAETEDGRLPYSACVLSLAARDCISTCRFTPTAAELIEAAGKQRQKFFEHHRKVERLSDVRDSLEQVLKYLDEDGRHPDDAFDDLIFIGIGDTLRLREIGECVVTAVDGIVSVRRFVDNALFEVESDGEGHVVSHRQITEKNDAE